jgi:hypothetical protein
MLLSLTNLKHFQVNQYFMQHQTLQNRENRFFRKIFYAETLINSQFSLKVQITILELLSQL